MKNILLAHMTQDQFEGQYMIYLEELIDMVLRNRVIQRVTICNKPIQS